MPIEGSVFDEEGRAEDGDTLLNDLATGVHSAWSQCEALFLPAKSRAAKA